jgi:NitT/TauT family transport system substrate-binding protein
MNFKSGLGLVVIAALALAGGCKKAADVHSVASGGAKAVLMLDWKPEPEFGGFYDARQSGAFTRAGLDMTIQMVPGGAEPYNMVINEKADFATTAADHVLVARLHRDDVVAIFAVFQTSPQGIMVHKARGFTSVADVFGNPGTLYAEDSSWLDFCRQKFPAPKVKVVTDPGAIGPFLTDPMASQQCFVFSEPLTAKARGSDPQSFLIADLGFNPYTTIVITRGKLAREHPEKVAAMVKACREGWHHYLADPGPANEAMHALNPDMDLATFAAEAEAQKPLIQTDGGKPVPLGSMTDARWGALSLQMVGLNRTNVALRGDGCFIPLPAE